MRGTGIWIGTALLVVMGQGLQPARAGEAGTHAGSAPGLVPAPLAAAAAHGQCREVSPPGAAPLRRLTRFEYENSIADLLGDVADHGRHFPEEGGSGFDNNGDVAVATRIHAYKYMTAAEAIAERAVRDLDTLMGCPAAEAGCVERFVTAFARKAWRRPLSKEETGDLLAFVEDERRRTDVASALRLYLVSVLQSPHFLYRIEVGVPVPGKAGLRRLTDHELAARLSYFLWGTTPDERLRRAADDGRLHTPTQVAAHARRLLDHPRARAVVRRFFDQWLGISLLDRLQKEKVFAWDVRRLAPLYRLQFDLFIDHVMWQADGRLETLLTTPVTFANPELANYLKMKGDIEGFSRITEGGGQRAGILTLPAFLAMQAKVQETAPIKRGIFVREQLLCQIPPPPPADMQMMELPPPSGDLVTVRERMEEHRLDFGCSKCHDLFDPLGLAFENYDSVGAWRGEELGHAIDASGEIMASDVDGPFGNVREMADRLANSRQVSDCMVRQWFRYAFGRTESQADACTLARLASAFTRSRGDIRELIIDITRSPAFLYRRTDSDALARSTRRSP